jgi:hypothetical protein
MPQVGYRIRSEAIIFREPALFNFAHCPNFNGSVRIRPLTASGVDMLRIRTDALRRAGFGA